MQDFTTLKNNLAYGIKLICVCLLVLGLITFNYWAIVAALTLYIIFYNITVSYLSVPLLIAFCYQWAQVSVKVIFASFMEKDLEQLTEFPDHIEDAFLLGSSALIIMSFFIGKYLKSIPLQPFNENKSIDVKKAQIAYFIFLGLSFVFENTLAKIGGMAQAYATFSVYKWMFFSYVYLVTKLKQSGKTMLWVLIITEFLNGFLSYFSDFKTVIFYVVIMESFFIKKEQIPKFAGLFVLGAFLAIFWTAIKGDYREFVSQDQGQIIVVSREQAFDKLISLSTSISSETWEEAKTSFLDRISYIDYFSSVISYTPTHIDHAGGDILWEGIERVLKPRLFFPGKSAIDESVHLTKYSGVFYSNNAMGVSFSVGYVGDFYIDFGVPGVLILSAVFGIVLGSMMKKIMSFVDSPLWLIALSVIFFNFMFSFEISLIKLVGKFIMFFLVSWIFLKYGFPKILEFLKLNE